MPIANEIVQYLREHALVVTTAESCTAGKIVTLLSGVEGSGEFIECGYVVYSPQAKQRLLHVSPQTIETFNLTSVEVAKEMAKGLYETALQMPPSRLRGYSAPTMWMEFLRAQFVLPGRFSPMKSAISSVTSTDSPADVVGFKRKPRNTHYASFLTFIAAHGSAIQVKPDERRRRSSRLEKPKPSPS